MDLTLSSSRIGAQSFSVSIEWSTLGPRPRNATATLVWWHALTGQSPRESHQWGWLDAVHPEDRDAVQRAWQRAIDSEEPYIAVFRVLTPANGEHLVLAYGTPRLEAGESITGWTGRMIDITQYERTTEYAAVMASLTSALGRARTTADILGAALNALDRTMKTDAGAILLRNSSGALEIGASIGLDEERVKSWSESDREDVAADGLGPDSLDSVWIERIDSQGGTTPEGVELFAGQGFGALASIPMADTGRFLGELIVAFRQQRLFTEIDREFLQAIALQVARALYLTRTLDDERLARESSELAHQHLKLVADAAPALIAWIDPDSTFRLANTTFPEWLGLEGPVPQGADVEAIVGPEVFEQLQPRIARALAGNSVSFEVVIGHDGDESRLVAVTLVPSFSRGGGVQGLALLGFDVSERERAIQRSQHLIDLSTALSHLSTYEEMVDVILRHATAAVGASSMAIVLASTGQAMVWSGPWEEGQSQFEHLFVPPEDPMWKAMDERRPVLIDHPSDQSLASPLLRVLPGADDSGQRVLLPLSAEFKRSGILAFAMPSGTTLTPGGIAYLTLLTEICAGALDRASLYDFLRARETRLRELADALPQIVWVSSGNGETLEYLNARWQEYTGLQSSEMRSGGISLLTHPDDREEERRRWQHSLKTGELFQAEIRLRRNDGAYRWFLNRGVPVRSEDGRIDTWFGTMTDINDQHEAMTHNRVISGLDTQIRLLFDPAQILQTLVTTIGRHLQIERCYVTEVSDRQSLTEADVDGLDDSIIPNITMRALWLNDASLEREFIRTEAPRLSSLFGKPLRRGQLVAMSDVEAEMESAEAREIAERLGVKALVIVPFLRGGRWVSSLTVHSLSPRRWTQGDLAIIEAAVKRTWPLVERSRAVEALAESENRLRHAAEAASFSSFDFDPRSGAGTWTADTARVFRKPLGTKAPETLEELVALVHPEDRERLRDLISQAIDPQGTGEVFGEFRHVTDDGEMCWVLVRGSSQFQGTGHERIATRISGILMDITPRKRDEEERLLALDAASHDLKNPVAAIRALAQVGKRLNQDGDAQMMEILESIEAATGRITAVISDVLDTARLRAGRELPLNLHMVQLTDLLNERVAEWAGAHPEREFVYQPGATSIEGCWDPERMRRVFDNLISNAVKFSPDGGEIKITVDLREDADGTWARVVISDRGIGIAAADMDRVQQTFERGSNVPASIPGTGMGLIAARLITQQHGGSLTVESKQNAGTTVTVELPVGKCRDPLTPAE